MNKKVSYAHQYLSRTETSFFLFSVFIPLNSQMNLFCRQFLQRGIAVVRYGLDGVDLLIGEFGELADARHKFPDRDGFAVLRQGEFAVLHLPDGEQIGGDGFPRHLNGLVGLELPAGGAG